MYQLSYDRIGSSKALWRPARSRSPQIGQSDIKSD
ncbi:uncharacterized protein G2W53_017497 [Senna tora]|uniref:Uncharacterized protein n=1 Tax=Senna tora TaxID=362788 RepID=A0A834TPC2_9FABA|nr:uncharacterized protein G2W53_017497 [Senna tora]